MRPLNDNRGVALILTISIVSLIVALTLTVVSLVVYLIAFRQVLRSTRG